MGEIYKPEKAVYFVAKNADGSIAHTGVTPPGNVTTTGQAILETASDEYSYLGLLDTVTSTFEELPQIGARLIAGQIYRFNDIAVMVRQDHERTEHDPTTVPALFFVYRTDDSIDWIANEQVQVGSRRTYLTILYECIQAHQTQVGWEPPNVPALWIVVPEIAGEWAVGVAYTVDQRVFHLGIEYYCIQAHTSQVGWEPPNVPALWGVYVE
jgi:hypothetical protein